MRFRQIITSNIFYLLIYCFDRLPQDISQMFVNIPLLRVPAKTSLIKKYGLNEEFFNLKSLASHIKLVKPFEGTTFIYTKQRELNLNYKIVLETEELAKASKIAIIAHYDPDGIIDNYVMNFLQHIKTLGYKIILVTCHEIEMTEELKNNISGLVIRFGAGYDFTSWQVAFQAFPYLYNTTEILISNDSIFAPVDSFEKIHKTMDQVDCDFWGLCESQEKNTHLQSYYLVFKKKALKSKVFHNFWTNLNVTNRQDAIKAELSLTTLFIQNGLKAAAYISSKCLPFNDISPIHYFWRSLIIIFKIPCFKRNLLRGELKHIDISDWRNVAKSKGYNPDLIDSYFKRIQH